LVNLNPSKAVVSNLSGALTTSSASATQIGYLANLASDVQAQINAKANDTAVVHLANSETISGAKNFSSMMQHQNVIDYSDTFNLSSGSNKTLTITFPSISNGGFLKVTYAYIYNGQPINYGIREANYYFYLYNNSITASNKLLVSESGNYIANIADAISAIGSNNQMELVITNGYSFVITGSVRIQLQTTYSGAITVE